MPDLTAARLRELLSYDPETGVFMRHAADGLTRRTGCVNNRGYLVLTVDRKLYSAHRLAFLYMTSEWPLNEIDHINRDKTDNRWINLRPATHSENHANARNRLNKTGFRGVSRIGKRYAARIFHRRRSISLGLYATPQEASDAYRKAARQLFGEYANPAKGRS
jgi:hypothetical protein